jgi:hypothetical protein|tara:strand:- start:67 stop:804 length:738 start_codon:yes stop_codon:yes gene_type:complete
MSRCILESDEHDVIIGWDPPIGSFFLQVLEPGGDIPLIWEGNGPRTYAVPDELIKLAVKFSRPFDQALLRSELMKDQAAHLERHYEIHGDIFWGTPANSAEIDDTHQKAASPHRSEDAEREECQNRENSSPDWVDAAKTRREELRRNFTQNAQSESEVFEDGTCQFCKNPLNRGASTCASCGAFKYSVEQRLLPGLFIACLPALFLMLLMGVSGLFVLIFPIGIYVLAKKKHAAHKGWAPPRSQW